jgi:putrescine transport system substrate-binding protein
MRKPGPAGVTPLLLSAILSIGCSGPKSGAALTPDDKVVNLYIWSDYLAPDTLAAFEKQTGITVRVSYFDNLETLESKQSRCERNVAVSA